ncbi:Sodium- and chloride-dependent GABA transporter 2 [Trichoplax sp. H2]|nr:Sodium- and chloride-dependent GABA transporter 2 [Trichoplax sp. H2]|eukprot:RDD46443.1 Sodium- and chloride-dependent GABA transporter 2 [Trichoplax sp. H2]
MGDGDDKDTSDGKVVADTESEEEYEREGWGKKIEFMLSCIGFAVGFGNLWRFPYLCYKYGGGAFLIPYFISLAICGVPLMALEFGIGQYFVKGPTVVFKKICPLLFGTGFSMIMVSFLVSIYYVVILAWVLYFLFASFISPLPWTTCDNSWNTPECLVRNGSNVNESGISPAVEYFNIRVLNKTANPDISGPVKWDLALLLILAWVIVYLCIFKGVKWTGKVVYFTATFPYLVLVILFFRGVTLDGAGLGISYYLKLDTSKLADIETWKEAGTQIFYSLGAGFGSLIAFASYNKRNNNFLKDAVVISAINCGTSFFAGFVIFSMLGYMSKQQGLPIEKVVDEGPGLVFMVYPAGLSTLPGSNFWSILFFFMLITLGLDSQFAMVEAISTGLTDFWPNLFASRRPYLILGLCIVEFLIGLTCITKGGIYIFDLFNTYSAGTAMIVTVLFEIMAVSWFYGKNEIVLTYYYIKYFSSFRKGGLYLQSRFLYSNNIQWHSRLVKLLYVPETEEEIRLREMNGEGKSADATV